jgi:hypothetical protein
MADRILHAAWLIAPLLLAACGSTTSQESTASAPSGSTTPAAAVATTTAAADVATTAAAAPTTFTSTVYGYAITVPAGWTSVSATHPWDGKSASSHEDPAADQWSSAGSSSSWALAAASRQTLRSYVKKGIAVNFATHGDTCPEKPAAQDPVTIGGDPGMLVAWNCGILINIGFAVHDGVGYQFGFRDPAVHAASDAEDRATFVALLESVRWPTS